MIRRSSQDPKLSDAERRLADRLRAHVDYLAGQIGPRHLGRPSAMDAAATFVERELAALGDPVERHMYHVDGHSVANLSIERPGTHRSAEIVILGAHYDTVDTTPGADDNASAIATLIEVARLLRGRRSQRTVRFVAFACEEQPHCGTATMGSQVYAHGCRTRGEQVVGMLCLEMVGYYSTAQGCQEVPDEIPRIVRWVFPRRADFLAAVGNLRSWRLCWTFRRGFKRAVRFPLFSIALPEAVGAIRRSDNNSFWDQGYPALMLTDTSFLRNPHYHRDTDMPDTLDYSRMAQVVVGIAGGVARLAKSAGRVRLPG